MQRLLLFVPLLASALAAPGATVLSDVFSTSTLNSASPAAPTVTSTAYQLFSSKTWSPTPSIATNDLRFGIGTTTSGHIEAQALFSTSPVTLTNVGDYLELIVKFTNTSGLLAQGGHVGFGLYNSGGVAPLAGGMNGTATTSTTGVTGGAQGWQGYVSRIAYDAGTHRIATRPAQSSTTGNNQDLVTEGSSSMSYTGAVNLASATSTLILAAGTQLTESLRLTLTGSNTCQLESKLYQGGDTLGPLLFSQTATGVSGVNFYNGFDALAIGWRATTNSFPTTIDIESITVNTQVAGSGNPVTGVYFQQQPTDAAVGANISPPVTVVATNASGGAVTNASITLTLASGTGTLNGATSQNTDAGGMATFTNLSLSASGPKQLRAASGSATATSATFNILTVTNPPPTAFPGAEGAGAYALGGRGGDVYYVTTLADSGAGSLRNGISTAPASGRSILFKVSGTIQLNSNLSINKSRLTIAGQTAPGDGIAVAGWTTSIQDCHDVVVRFIRCRAGDVNCPMFQDDSCHVVNGTNLVLDHISSSWSIDETLSVTHSTNVTVQWCLITESLKNSCHVKGPHGYGSLLRYGAGAITYHHNLYADHESRNPRPGDNIHLDFVNNLVYNWGGTAGYNANDTADNPGGFTNVLNYVGNYFIAGPSTTGHLTVAFDSGVTNADSCEIYQLGNLIDSNQNPLLDGANTGWSMFSAPYHQRASRYPLPPVATDSAPMAYERVLAFAGASLPRDAVDLRIITDVRTHTGAIIDSQSAVGGYPLLSSTTAPVDTDSDGMPDYWELALGLDPNNAADRNLTNSLTGYTRLEDYLNWLAAPHALCNRNGQADVDLQAASGGSTNLTYTVTNGTNGTVTLLGDGHTARFTAAANYTGLANFGFSATDTFTGLALGTNAVGILVTTTNAPNTPPTLAAISNRTVIAGTAITFTNAASDPDAPPQTLTFTLFNGPTNATINSSNGILFWRPLVAQSPSTNGMAVVVTDSGVPNQSATQSFNVTVLKPAQPALLQPALAAGQFGFRVAGEAGPDYTIEASTNLVNWTNLFTTNSPALPFNWSDPAASSYSQRFYRVLLGP